MLRRHQPAVPFAILAVVSVKPKPQQVQRQSLPLHDAVLLATCKLCVTYCVWPRVCVWVRIQSLCVSGMTRHPVLPPKQAQATGNRQCRCYTWRPQRQGAKGKIVHRDDLMLDVRHSLLNNLVKWPAAFKRQGDPDRAVACCLCCELETRRLM